MTVALFLFFFIGSFNCFLTMASKGNSPISNEALKRIYSGKIIMGPTQQQQHKFITTWSPSSEQPNNRRIYFHGARGKNSLATIRQSCAVESAARHNPDRPIQLFISTDDPDGKGIPMDRTSDPWLSVLERYENVRVIVYNESDYFAGTPLENWYREGLWRRSSRRGLVHLSDYWRMLSSYRAGGFYMDLDVITFKQLDEKKLRNFFSLEDKRGENICSGIFHMDHGHWLINAMVRQLAAKKYDPNIYNAYGPLFVKKILVSHCGLELPDVFTNTCPDVKVLSRTNFFPIPWEEWQIYFMEVKETFARQLTRKSFGVHVWNKLSGNQTFVKNSRNLYAQLVAEHCPLTFAAAA